MRERADYGELAKTAIRRATREAAITEVTRVAAGSPQLADVSVRLGSSTAVRRPLLGRAEKMSRGVQPINLNQGQDFEGALEELVAQVESEIEWELGEALPTMKDVIHGTDSIDDVKSAEHIAHNAPTNLHPDGPKWYERAPVISAFFRFTIECMTSRKPTVGTGRAAIVNWPGSSVPPI